MSNRYPGGVVRKNQLTPAANGASGMWTIEQASQATKSDIWPYSGIANPISQSLRFKNTSSAYLTRTAGSPTNANKWTWSGWVKRGTLSANAALFGAWRSANCVVQCYFQTDNTLRVYLSNGDNSAYLDYQTSQVFRDSSAWYHIVVSVDNTLSTTSVIIYVNGVQVTSYGTSSNILSQNVGLPFNYSGTTIYMGQNRNTGNGAYGYYDGYMTDINFVDGQVLTPSYFGQTSAITGVWEPKLYSGTYGNNGFHLEFKDTTIGKDTSGNNNHWTPNNFSTTNDYTYDLVKDVPVQWAPRNTTDVGGVVRGNYATFNSAFKVYGNPTFSDSNSTITSASANYNIGVSTIGIPPNSGKWYWEQLVSGNYSSACYCGIMNATGLNVAAANDNWATRYGYGIEAMSSSASTNSNYYYAPDTSAACSPSVTFNSGSIICWAYDSDTGKMWIGKNGSWVGNNSGVIGDPSTGTNALISSITSDTWYPVAGVYQHPSLGTTAAIMNFGQQPFVYTPPTGFKSLCTTNLPTPTIGATTATAANKYMDVTLITGTAATQVITNAGGFQPDFVWLKSRTNANNPTIYDAIRGVNTVLYPALTNAEVVGSAQLTAFNSNGFTLGASENANDSSGEASVGWQWNAGGSTVTNTSGSISSQVRANPTAGFSVVSYTGNATGGATIGHGLGAVPNMIIAKPRSASGNWIVYHSSLGNTKSLYLQSTATINTDIGYWNNTSPTSSVFSLGAGSDANQNGVASIAYCWTAIPGYSAFGSYTGNGSTNGPFIYTGFRPKFFMTKVSSGTTHDWVIMDSARSAKNRIDEVLFANLVDAESLSWDFDFVSNGIKLRYNGRPNNSGDTYIYMAFAENPFKYALAR